ncbi:hypothetical protein JNUCC0626_33675 [Lentzea sp. JNUCC 0626]|uniref:hypothetical protein n=1 Tax=Lentzea sp. JNUCC 0626 TaxID=3367513 RepID=UPI0037485090
MRKKVIAALLTGLALVLAVVTPAQAKPKANEVSAAANCFTTFVPSAPEGGPMTQYYKNCNGAPIRVGKGFVNASGQISVYVQSCQQVGVGETISWGYASTDPNANYHTVICTSSFASPEIEAVSGAQCWTTFYPLNPNGGSMVHVYKNCNPTTVTVATGRTDGSGQISVFTNSCAGAAPQAGVLWRYGSTAQGSNYHTILCVY